MIIWYCKLCSIQHLLVLENARRGVRATRALSEGALRTFNARCRCVQPPVPRVTAAHVPVEQRGREGVDADQSVLLEDIRICVQLLKHCLLLVLVLQYDLLMSS